MIKRMVLITDILILLLFGPGIILLCLYWPVFMSNMRILRNAGFIVGGVWTLLGICFFLNVISYCRKRLEYISLIKFMNHLKQVLERSCKRRDVMSFLKKYTRDVYPVDTVNPVICHFCRNDVFQAYYEDGNGSAAKCCICGKTHYLLDSGQHWAGAPIMFTCPKCGALSVNLWVGLSHHKSGDIRWVYILFQCPTCHALDIMLEWEAKVAPSRPAEEK